jgi:hypothetical protein
MVVRPTSCGTVPRRYVRETLAQRHHARSFSEGDALGHRGAVDTRQVSLLGPALEAVGEAETDEGAGIGE